MPLKLSRTGRALESSTMLTLAKTDRELSRTAAALSRRRAGGGDLGDLVVGVPERVARRPRHRRCLHKWRSAVDTGKLPAGTGFHGLRHYYASLLIRHGESVKTVQARLGHASAVETLDTYSHLWPDSDDRTRAAIDSVLGSTPTENAADQLRTVEELTP